MGEVKSRFANVQDKSLGFNYKNCLTEVSDYTKSPNKMQAISTHFTTLPTEGDFLATEPDQIVKLIPS